MCRTSSVTRAQDPSCIDRGGGARPWPHEGVEPPLSIVGSKPCSGAARHHHVVDQDEEERPWPDAETVFTPLVHADRALAERLVARFTQVLHEALSGGEPEYATGYGPPQVEVGTEPGGEQLLRISFGGGVTLMEWDGTEENADAIIQGVAANDAYGASADYWLVEGWRTRPTSTGREGAE